MARFGSMPLRFVHGTVQAAIREVLHGVGADGVGVKFPIFAVNCCSLPLSFRRRGEMRKKRGKMRKKGEKCVKKGKITPTPSTPTPLRTSQAMVFGFDRSSGFLCFSVQFKGMARFRFP